MLYGSSDSELINRLKDAEEKLDRYKEAYKDNLIYCISISNNTEDIKSFLNDYIAITLRKTDDNVSNNRRAIIMGNDIIDSLNIAEANIEKFKEAYKDNLITCMRVTRDKEDIENFFNDYIDLIK